MTRRTALPDVTADLVDHLSAIYPDRCPHPDDTDRQIWIAVGSRQVVAYLEAMLEEQHEADDFDFDED